MALKDPTAWMDDLAVYMDDEDIANTAATVEPTLIFGGSRIAGGLWIGLAGILGGVLGALSLSPGIRRPVTFVGYVAILLLTVRGLNPLTKRLFGNAMAWQTMVAFFWGAVLAFFSVLGAGFETRWIAYAVSVGCGAFVGLMYGSLTPGAIRREDTWLLGALPLAPLAAGLATYLLRHPPASDIWSAAIAGSVAGGVLLLPMGVLLGRLWDESHGLGHMGLLYLHNENFAPKAVAYFDRALAVDPDNARYYDLRAVGLGRMGEFDRAAADWDTATRLSPASPDPHIHRGELWLRRGDIAAAIRSFETAISKSPRSSHAHRAIAAAYERDGDAARALKHYDHAVAAGDDDARAYVERGAAHVRRGNHRGALRDADRALELDPGMAAAYVTRGHALAAMDRLDEADDSYRNAIELDPEPSVREDALRGLEKIGRADPEE